MPKKILYKWKTNLIIWEQKSGHDWMTSDIVCVVWYNNVIWLFLSTYSMICVKGKCGSQNMHARSVESWLCAIHHWYGFQDLSLSHESRKLIYFTNSLCIKIQATFQMNSFQTLFKYLFNAYNGINFTF